jgi:hypothetical protein
VVTYRSGFEGFGDDGVSPTKGSGYFGVLQLNVEGDVRGIDDFTGGVTNPGSPLLTKQIS